MIVVSHSYFIRALFKNYTHQHALDQIATPPGRKYGEQYQVVDLGNLKLKVSIGLRTRPPRMADGSAAVDSWQRTLMDDFQWTIAATTTRQP